MFTCKWNTGTIADGTYKLNFHGFPVILVGTTDKHRHFHPLCICVSTHEKSADYAFVFQCIKEGVQKQISSDFIPSSENQLLVSRNAECQEEAKNYQKSRDATAFEARY